MRKEWKRIKKVSDIVGRFIDLKKKRRTAAVILCAGSGTRFSGDQTKQLTEIGGLPVIVRTVRAFEETDEIAEIILVVKKDEQSTVRELMERYGMKKVVKIVPGGQTRQESASIGVGAVSDEYRYVAIHDGARCLVTPDMIKKVLLSAYEHRAAIAASHQAVDTIKLATAKGFIAETVDRETVWHASTPQVFQIDLYRSADAVARRDGFAVTDDAMLAEHTGFAVKLVDVGTENIKITVPEDRERAEKILAKRGNL